MRAGVLSGLRVLVVEDEELLVGLLEDQLQDLGCGATVTARRLEEALEKAQSADVDVAVLDLSLAGHSSTPVARVLAARDIPFVVATGFSHVDMPDGLGDRPVLRKPFRQVQLASALIEAADRSNTTA
jgi:CheY-like chemotaxis protein